MASEELERLARTRMQLTGETFEQALAALEGRPSAAVSSPERRAVPRQADGESGTPVQPRDPGGTGEPSDAHGPRDGTNGTGNGTCRGNVFTLPARDREGEISG